MSSITFILGGARSGKSRKAIILAKEMGGKVAFIATCQPKDQEMARRISAHKKARPASWKTFECPKDIVKVLKGIGNGFDLIIIDCLTLWVSNLLLAGSKEKKIEHEIKLILISLKKIKPSVIIVSNEVGLGIVPDNELGRSFRDIAGRVNQLVADQADSVLFMLAGLPIRLKPGETHG